MGGSSSDRREPKANYLCIFGSKFPGALRLIGGLNGVDTEGFLGWKGALVFLRGFGLVDLATAS